MQLAWRALLVLVVFAGVGFAVDRAVLRHERGSTAPESQVRLAGAMAGLFTGGAAGSVLTLMLAFSKRR